MIKGLRKTWLFEVSESSSKGYWKQFLLFHPYKHDHYLPVVEKPGYLNLLKALQEDTGNYEHSQILPAAEGDTLPRGKVSSLQPPTLMYAFIFMLW